MAQGSGESVACMSRTMAYVVNGFRVFFPFGGP